MKNTKRALFSFDLMWIMKKCIFILRYRKKGFKFANINVHKVFKTPSVCGCILLLCPSFSSFLQLLNKVMTSEEIGLMIFLHNDRLRYVGHGIKLHLLHK